VQNYNALLLACVLIATANSLRAQVGQISAWTPCPGDLRLKPKMACSSLRALTGYGFSVISANLEEPASGDVPEFCRVLGQVQPEIKFEVALPTSWNGRLLMIGNGGYAGENLEAPDRLKSRAEAVRSGFVFTETNTGHEAQNEPLGAFAADSQKLLNYAFRAVHVSAETAKRLAAAYYGSTPMRSYFMGCSTGGRQALISAQRFPRDFDGILAGAPVLDFVGTMQNYANIMRAFQAAPLSESKLKLIGNIAYAQCDAKGGLKDGVIEDPRVCNFEPALHVPKCGSADAEDCFTEGQIHSLETLYSDQKTDGKRVFPGWPVGAEAAGTNGRIGRDPWLVRQNDPPHLRLVWRGFSSLSRISEKNPDFHLCQFDFERDPPQLDGIRRVLNATDTDMSDFRDRGGKLLMWFGWADPALNPRMGVEYYESVVRQMGPSTRDFFRLFMLPGVFHCFGGVGCDSASGLGPLINWVEQDTPPDRLIASRLQSGKVVRSRRLCPYPEVAKYKGAGSSDEAANFGCVLPEAVATLPR
jgi:Tannase and feruloyl esterase